MADIAILGASGQIGRGLALEFSRSASHRLALYTRNPDALVRSAAGLGFPRPGIDQVLPLDRFGEVAVDAVINAVGDGDRTKQIALGGGIFNVTETYDALCIDYLNRHPEALYFFMSTGAVYGFNAPWPVRRDASFSWPVNQPQIVNYYPLAKLVAEAKHRALPDKNIYDIRIFGYFSRFIPLDGGFFLSEVAKSIARRQPLMTPPVDMVRDYVDQRELSNLIELFLMMRPDSGAYDIYSKASVGKIELLGLLGRECGLETRFDAPLAGPLKLLPKPPPSDCAKAAEAGHRPRRSSAEIVVGEMRALLAASGIPATR